MRTVEVAQAVLGRAQGGFPHRPFVALAVAADDEHALLAPWRSRAPSAMPTPIGSPCPRLPVEASTPGTLPYSGWPPRMPSAGRTCSVLPRGRIPCPPARRKAPGSHGPCSGCSGRAAARQDSWRRSATRCRKARGGSPPRRRPRPRARGSPRPGCGRFAGGVPASGNPKAWCSSAGVSSREVSVVMGIA